MGAIYSRICPPNQLQFTHCFHGKLSRSTSGFNAHKQTVFPATQERRGALNAVLERRVNHITKMIYVLFEWVSSNSTLQNALPLGATCQEGCEHSGQTLQGSLQVEDHAVAVSPWSARLNPRARTRRG